MVQGTNLSTKKVYEFSCRQDAFIFVLNMNNIMSKELRKGKVIKLMLTMWDNFNAAIDNECAYNNFSWREIKNA